MIKPEPGERVDARIVFAAEELEVNIEGRRVVRGVSIEIRQAEFVAVLGPNGAGKSTLLRALIGVSEIGAGNVFVNGATVLPNPYAMLKSGVAFCPQGGRAFNKLTVQENLELVRAHEPTADDLVEEIYELVPRLRENRRKLAGALSGGEQQLVAIGSVLAGNPRIVLLDEPLLGIAVRARAEVLDLLSRWRRNRALSALIVEQNVDDILPVVDFVYVLRNGLVRWEGSPSQFSMPLLHY